jgi:ribosomal protein L37E
MRYGPCPRCQNELVGPSFSLDVPVPACSHCGYPASDIVAEAREMVESAHAEESVATLALRLSANVGCYQTALCDGDHEAARAFLANVLAIGAMLLARGS